MFKKITVETNPLFFMKSENLDYKITYTAYRCKALAVPIGIWFILGSYKPKRGAKRIWNLRLAQESLHDNVN